MNATRFTAGAAVFAAASLALAGFLTGFGAEQPTGDRLARAGSPVSPAMIALVVALVLGGIVFLIVGAKRRKGQ
ncbi:hypothetical protein [Mariniluteicoccus flavus]